jgi:hypothetical protein
MKATGKTTLAAESLLPYHRPPLTKGFLFVVTYRPSAILP